MYCDVNEHVNGRLLHLQEVRSTLLEYDSSIMSVHDMPIEVQQSVAYNLKQLLQILSTRMSDIRKKEVKQKMALDKFHKFAGPSWRISKHLF